MYLDTNYLLRYILDDIPEQSEMAVEAIRAGASTYAEVIPEVVYVLDKVYKIERNEVASAIANMLEDVHVDHADVILGALELYARTGLDYVNCLMLSGFQEEGKPAVEILPGTVIHIPANVKHWHGAAADSWFAHLAFEVPGEETSNEWLEPVSDMEYNQLETSK